MSEEASQIAKERRQEKGKGERERYTQLNAEFPQNNKERKDLPRLTDGASRRGVLDAFPQSLLVIAQASAPGGGLL